MCLAVPGQVLEVDALGLSAVVDVFGTRRTVQLHLLDEPPAVGDWLISHLTFAIERIAPEDVESTLAVFRQLVPGNLEALAREPVD